MNKNRSSLAIFLLVLLVTIGSFLNPQSDTAKAAAVKSHNAYVTSYTLKVRNHPSTHYKTKKVLEMGNRVWVTRTYGRYSRVKYGTMYGYVQSKYLSRSKFKVYTAYVTSYTLKVRSRASVHYSVRKLLNMSDRVTVVGKGNKYARVKYGNVIGYVQNKYLSRSRFRSYSAYVTSYTLKVRSRASVHYSVRKLLNMSDRVTVVGKGNKYARVKYGNVIGYVQNKHLSRSKFRSYSAYVTSYTLKVRSRASIHYTVRRQLSMSDRVTVIGKGKKYAKIQFGSTVGYVQNIHLSRSKYKSYSAVVTSPTLQLRSKASSKGYKTLLVFPKGRQLTVTGKGDQYAQINYGGKKGYVEAKYLSAIRKVSYQVKLQPRSQASFKAYAAYVTSDELNVRSSPTSAKNNAFAVLKKNVKITVIWETGKWLKIKFSNGRVGYVSAGYIMKGSAPKTTGSSKQPSMPPSNTTSILGVDISHWQSNIDFNAIKQAGIRFVIVKATEGQTYRDSNFYDHVKRSQTAGLSTYAYHFLRADSTTEAVKEANFFVKTINGRISKNSYVYLDVEDVSGDPLTKDKEKLTSYINAFLNVLNQNGYHKFGIYTGFNFYYERINASKLPNNTRLWIARYRYDRKQGWDSTYKGLGMPADIWQFRSDGKIRGISGDVDLNISYFTDASDL